MARLHGWYRSVLDKRRARHLRQPLYPFAGTVGVLRRTVQRLGRTTDPQVLAAYCDGLPANMYCRVDERSVVWWILSEHMLWMVQVDRTNLAMAFAACADFHAEHPEADARMRELVLPLYAAAEATPIAWEERLALLGKMSAKWMRRNRPGTCLPGLVVLGRPSTSLALSHDPIRTARQLEKPQRLEVAVPLILHGLWSELRQENTGRVGEVADAWQLACALVDNPWESWQTVRSGRLSEMG